jgi:hypothetical protein
MKTGDQIYRISEDFICTYPMIFISREGKTITAITPEAKNSCTDEELKDIVNLQGYVIIYYYEREQVAFTKAEAKKKLQKLFDQRMIEIDHS